MLIVITAVGSEEVFHPYLVGYRNQFTSIIFAPLCVCFPCVFEPMDLLAGRPMETARVLTYIRGYLWEANFKFTNANIPQETRV